MKTKKKLNLQTLVQKTLNTLNFEEYFLKSSGRWCKQSENRNENSLKIFYSRVENLTANYPMAKNRSFWYGPRSVSGGHRIIFCHQHTDNHFSWDYSESLLAFINTRLFRFNFSWQNFPNRTHTQMISICGGSNNNREQFLLNWFWQRQQWIATAQNDGERAFDDMADFWPIKWNC